MAADPEQTLGPVRREPAATARLALPWRTRLSELVSGWLPILLMGLLALGTWWLVENSPKLEPVSAERPARHAPDYTMSRFSVQRFAADGRLRIQIDGQELRHFPDTDTIEVDLPRIRAQGPDDRTTLATARQALSNGDGSEVQLIGDAKVQREGDTKAAAIDFSGEFLHAFFDTETLRSHRPVVIRSGSTELRADRFEYRQLDQRVEFGGRIRARFEARGRPDPQ